MKIIIHIHIFLVLSLVMSCQQYDCNDFENHIKSVVSVSAPINEICLSTFNDFTWDELYIIEGPRISRDVEKIAGSHSLDMEVPDDATLYAFLHKKKVVSASISSCYDLNVLVMNDKGYVNYQNTDTLKIQMKETRGGMKNYYILRR